MSEQLKSSPSGARYGGLNQSSGKIRGGGVRRPHEFVNWTKLAWKPPTVRVMELKRTSGGGNQAIAQEDPPDYLPPNS